MEVTRWLRHLECATSITWHRRRQQLLGNLGGGLHDNSANSVTLWFVNTKGHEDIIEQWSFSMKFLWHGRQQAFIDTVVPVCWVKYLMCWVPMGDREVMIRRHGMKVSAVILVTHWFGQPGSWQSIQWVLFQCGDLVLMPLLGSFALTRRMIQNR